MRSCKAVTNVNTVNRQVSADVDQVLVTKQKQGKALTDAMHILVVDKYIRRRSIASGEPNLKNSQMESTATASAVAAETPLSLLLYATTCTTRATHLHLFLIPLIVTCVLLLLFGSRRRHHESAGVAGAQCHGRPPPPPRGLPVVGNLHQLGRLPHRSLRALASSHGPVMLLRLGRVPAVVVSSADAAREVMQAQDHAFATRPSLAIPRRLLYGCTDIAFAPCGPYWRGARKMAMRHLLGPSRVRAYRAVREQEVDALVRRVEENDACRDGVVRLSELLSGFAKDVAGRIVLGLRAGGDEGWRDKIDALLDESNVLLATFHVGDYIPWLSWVSAIDGTDARVQKAFQRIDRILDEIVEDAGRRIRTGSEVSDDAAFVHVLLSLQKQSPGTELPLSMDNVKALLEDLFGAGTEATIIVLEWAMSELLRNQSAMCKLQNEVRQATRGSLVTEQDLQGME